MHRHLMASLVVLGLALPAVACKHTATVTDASEPAVDSQATATDSPADPAADVAVVAVASRSLEGTARNAKLGAVLVTADGNVWVDLEAWPDELIGKKLRVEGRMITKTDVPVVAADADEPAAGVPVEAGQAAAAASREVLSEATWSVLE